MNVHVVGGSGFLGSRVVPSLVARGHDVSALARSLESCKKLELLGATPIYGNLDDTPSLHTAFERSGAEALVNVSSLGRGHAPEIVGAAEKVGFRRAVFLSTTSVFTAIPAVSKTTRVAAEGCIRSSRLDWTILRPTMIYGAPDDRNMARLLRLLKLSPIVPLPGGGQRLQQPVHVQDLADVIATVLDRPRCALREYNLAGPDPLTLRQIVEQAADALGRRVRLVSVPLGVARLPVRAYEAISDRPLVKTEQLDRLAEDKVFDIAAARADLDFDPRTFAAGIQAEAQELG